MEFLLEKIRKNLNEQMILLTISNPRRTEEIRKYSIRPVLVKDRLLFQRAAYTKTQVFHRNMEKEELMTEICEILPLYKQVQMQTAGEEFTALLNKNGKAAIKVKKQNSPRAPLPENKDRLLHNRTKRHILPHLAKDREITILDFGCGKSYLTFAMYYYLKEQKGYDIRIIGLDLKKDVIKNCSRLAKKYAYEKLFFYEGSIEEFEGVEKVDMVVTLHACDTATDYALYKAVCWGASVILSVPCCQHELNGQMRADTLKPVGEYGILKERFCALATDAIRAKLLESRGYDTKILEFIDMEHTPKNLLIRAVRRKGLSGEKRKHAEEEVGAFCREFGFEPTLAGLLFKKEGQTIES